MDDGFLDFSTKHQSLRHYRLVSPAEQRRWIEAGEAIGGGLQALARGLEAAAHRLLQNGRTDRASLSPPPSST